MNIGEAVEFMKAGGFVARAGWHGQGMRIYLLTTKLRDLDPCIAIVLPSGRHQPGWVCSQADLLAEDWHGVSPSGAVAFEVPEAKGRRELECKLCGRMKALGSEYCERHREGLPVEGD